MWLVAPPFPAPWFPIPSQPLGASGCPPGHTEPDQSSRNAGCPPQAPQPLPPPAPSLSQPPPTVMNSHLPLPPWEHGFHLHSFQLLWDSRQGTAGAPPASQAPLAARVHSGRLLLSSCRRSPRPEEPEVRARKGSWGRPVSDRTHLTAPQPQRLRPQDVVQMPLWAHRPRHTLLPGIGGRHPAGSAGRHQFFPGV